MNAISDQPLADGLAPGGLVDAYEIRRELGRTAAEIEYLAYDASKRTEVHLREYFPIMLARRRGSAPGDGAVVRDGEREDAWQAGLRAFADEAQWLATIEHPALRRIIDVVYVNRTIYSVSEEQGGTPWPTGNQAPRCDHAALKALMEPLLGVLDAMHRNDRYHGALAPANLLRLPNGQPLLLTGDAAVRRLSQWIDDLPQPLHAGYAAIEQYLDDEQSPLGPWTDIYALAAVAYEALTGTRPPPAVQRCIADDHVPLTRLGLPGYPASVLSAIDAALAMRPEARPRDIGAWAAMLDMTPMPAPIPSAPEVSGTSATPAVQNETPAPRVDQTRVEAVPKRRSLAPWYAAAAVLLMVVGAGAWWMIGPKQNNHRSDVALRVATPPKPLPPQPAEDPSPVQSLEPPRPLESVPSVDPARATSQPDAAQATQGADSQTVANGLPVNRAEGDPASLVATAMGTATGTGPATGTAVAGTATATPAPMVPAGATPTLTPMATPPGTVVTTVTGTAAGIAPVAPADTRPVVVHLQISPWGDVSVNGKSRGPSPPLRELSLPPGTYRIRISNADLPPYESTLTVQAGKPVTIAHQF